MTFKKMSLALFAVALFAPLSASALGIQIVNTTYSGGSNMEQGDTVTFDLLLENSTNIPIQGLDVGVFGYDTGAVGSAADNSLVFTGAASGAGAFGNTFVPGFNLSLIHI